MKLTKRQLKQLIKEELDGALYETGKETTAQAILPTLRDHGIKGYFDAQGGWEMSGQGQPIQYYTKTHEDGSKLAVTVKVELQ